MAASRATVEIVATLRDAISTPLRGIRAAVTTAFGGLRGLVTGGLGAAFFAATKNVAETEAGLARMARTTRDTVEDVSALRFALDALGIGGGNLKEILNQLEGKRADALRGGGQARTAFGRLGVELAELQTIGGTEILRQLGDAYLSAGRSADAAAQLQAIFGDRFRELLPLLEGGSAGFAKLKQQAGAVGALVSTQDAAAAERFTQVYTEFAEVASGLFRELANEILPQLTEGLSALRRLLGQPTATDQLLGLQQRIDEQAAIVEQLRSGLSVVRTAPGVGAFGELEASAENIEAAEQKLRSLRAEYEKLAKTQSESVSRLANLVAKIPTVPENQGFLAGFRAEVAKTSQELADLYKVGERTARDVAGTLENNVNRVLDGIRQGTIETRNAFRSLIDGIIADLTDLAQRELVKRIFNTVLSYLSGGAGAGEGAGAGASSGGSGRLIGDDIGGGRKRLGGRIAPSSMGSGGTTINLSSNATQEEQVELVSAIMRHEFSRNRRVRLAARGQ